MQHAKEEDEVRTAIGPRCKADAVGAVGVRKRRSAVRVLVFVAGVVFVVADVFEVDLGCADGVP